MGRFVRNAVRSSVVRIAATLLTLAAIPVQAEDVAPQIVGGVPAPSGQYRTFVGLTYGPNNTYRCGGTLVARDWVLTAAHCFANAQYQGSVKAHIGMTQRVPTIVAAETVAVASFVVHPGYAPTDPTKARHHDLMLLKLATPASWTHGTMPLDDGFFDLTPVGRTLWAAGFGFTAPGSGHSNVLMHVSLPVLADHLCIDVPPGYPSTNYDRTIHVCAGPGTASGDSGGPLMLEVPLLGPLQVGITASSLYPPASLYTRISAHYDWICSYIH